MKILKNKLNSLIDHIINEAIEDYPFLDDIIVRDKNNNLLKWNGSSFEPYNEPVQAVTATPSYPLGSTAKPGKNVGEMIQSRTGKIYRWNGKSWSAVGRKNTTTTASASQSSPVATNNTNIPLGSTSKAGTHVGQLIQSRTGRRYRWNGKSWSAVGRVTKSNVATAPVSVDSEPNTSSNLSPEVEPEPEVVSKPEVENTSTQDNTSNGTQTYYVHFLYKYLKDDRYATLWVDASSPKEAEDKIRQRVKTYIATDEVYTI
jgi:hypothetical protein